jgi:hypothetical protein
MFELYKTLNITSDKYTTSYTGENEELNKINILKHKFDKIIILIHSDPNDIFLSYNIDGLKKLQDGGTVSDTELETLANRIIKTIEDKKLTKSHVTKILSKQSINDIEDILTHLNTQTYMGTKLEEYMDPILKKKLTNNDVIQELDRKDQLLKDRKKKGEDSASINEELKEIAQRRCDAEATAAPPAGPPDSYERVQPFSGSDRLAARHATINEGLGGGWRSGC